MRAWDQGRGPVILVSHPGHDDGTWWPKGAARLCGRFRVVRIVRRQYRPGRPAPGRCPMAREVGDVLALAQVTGEPMVVAGHSPGGVVALEVLAAGPPALAGAVLFEPPAATGPAAGSEAADRARPAIAAGPPGKARQIVARAVAGMRAADAWMLRVLVTAIPTMRALAPRPVTGLDGAGLRPDARARISTPAVPLGGERSPARPGQRRAARAAALPPARTVIPARRGHRAHRTAPGEVAQAIETPASPVLPRAPAAGRGRRAARTARAPLKVSLAGADDKLTQIDAALRRQATTVQLGMPAFPGILPDSAAPAR